MKPSICKCPELGPATHHRTWSGGSTSWFREPRCLVCFKPRIEPADDEELVEEKILVNDIHPPRSSEGVSS